MKNFNMTVSGYILNQTKPFTLQEITANLSTIDNISTVTNLEDKVLDILLRMRDDGFLEHFLDKFHVVEIEL